MAKKRKRGRKVVKYVRGAVTRAKARRRKGGGGMGGLIPNVTDVLYSGAGGAGYAFLKKFGQEYIGGTMGKVATAAAIHVAGTFAGFNIGVGAIGALAADLFEEFVGNNTSDYFNDYFSDNGGVSLPLGGAGNMMLPSFNRVGDISRNNLRHAQRSLMDGNGWHDSY